MLLGGGLRSPSAFLVRISIRSISILFDKSIGFCIPSGGTVVLVWMKDRSHCN